jgi:hypothetical protein
MIVIKMKMTMRMLSLETIVCLANATGIAGVFLEDRMRISKGSDVAVIAKTRTVARTFGIVDVMKAVDGAWDGMIHPMVTGVNPATKILDRAVWDINHINRLLVTSLHGKITGRDMANTVHHMEVNISSMVVKAMLSDSLVNNNGPIASGVDSLDRIIHMVNIARAIKDNTDRVGDNNIIRDNTDRVGDNNIIRDNMDKVGDNNIIKVGVNTTKDKGNMDRASKGNMDRVSKDNMDRVGDNNIILDNMDNMDNLEVNKTN